MALMIKAEKIDYEYTVTRAHVKKHAHLSIFSLESFKMAHLYFGLKDLRDRAFRAFLKIKNDLGSSFNQDVPLSLIHI